MFEECEDMGCRHCINLQCELNQSPEDCRKLEELYAHDAWSFEHNQEWGL